MDDSNKGTGLYKVVRLAGAPFRFHVTGLENVQAEGPAIYVTNHLGSMGPIASILSMPMRLYPWVIGEMTDPKRAPRYMYDDFVRPAWHLNGRIGMAVSTVVSKAAVGLLNGLGSVAVDRNRGPSIDAFHRSLVLLAKGQSLLVFPEDPAEPLDPATQMRPFFCGFVRLCTMYEQATGNQLPLYPVCVYPGTKTITVGRPIFFEKHGDRRQDVIGTCRRLFEAVGELYTKQRTEHTG